MTTSTARPRQLAKPGQSAHLAPERQGRPETIGEERPTGWATAAGAATAAARRPAARPVARPAAKRGALRSMVMMPLLCPRRRGSGRGTAPVRLGLGPDAPGTTMQD